MVQPMQINVEGRPGALVRQKFKLENRDKYESHYVTMEIVDLVQAKSGTWSVLDANTIDDPDVNYNPEAHSSCKDWVRLRNTQADIPAFDSTLQQMDIRIPKGKRGFACAALRVRLAPRGGVGGVVIRL